MCAQLLNLHLLWIISVHDVFFVFAVFSRHV